jgi:hypothetical protein
MHSENENEKERLDDVFVIVIVFVLVRNLPIDSTAAKLSKLKKAV